MCFHTSQIKTVKELEDFYNIDLYDDMAREAFDVPSYHLNGFVHPTMLIIPQEEPSKLVVGKWGIVPSNTEIEKIDAYYKKAVQYGGGLNAQSEKLFDHFIYKYSATAKRCIIPVTGFFEPHTYKSKKYPFLIEKKNKEIIALAGIYTIIEGLLTFSILTKQASPLFAKIHNKRKRQPILLNEEFTTQWLDNELRENQINEFIDHPYPDQHLETYPVSKALFSPRENSNNESILQKELYNDLVF